MCFQSLVSYFLGVFSMLTIFCVDEKYRSIGILSFILFIGFFISELICSYIHKKCKERYEERKRIMEKDKNFKVYY